MECLDISCIGSTNMNAAIKDALKRDKELKLINVNSMHNVCAGIIGEGSIIIEDSTGLYTGSYLEGLSVRVKGNVGWYAGDDMMDGELVIEKNTGCNVGAYINGGTIVIYGNTGSRVGYGMKGGNIIVCGNAGRWAGIMAMGGELIVLGEVGQRCGESMYSGKIFTRDPETESKMGDNVFLDVLTEEEKSKLDGLFLKYEINAKSCEFQVIRPVLSGRHEYKLFKPDLKPELAKKYTVKRG
jgi:methylamine---glutamate N-methyltransferase subunit B